MSSPGFDSPQHRIFAMLDVDGDGAITHAEYLGRVDRVASAMDRPADHPVVVGARAAHEAVFDDMDADHDGRVTFEEYRTWVGHEAFERSCRPALGSLFDIADTDATGALTATSSSDCVQRRAMEDPAPVRPSTPSTPIATDWSTVTPTSRASTTSSPPAPPRWPRHTALVGVRKPFPSQHGTDQLQPGAMPTDCYAVRLGLADGVHAERHTDGPSVVAPASPSTWSWPTEPATALAMPSRGSASQSPPRSGRRRVRHMMQGPLLKLRRGPCAAYLLGADCWLR